MSKVLRLAAVAALVAVCAAPAFAQIPTSQIVAVPASAAITGTIDLYSFTNNPSSKESASYPLIIAPPAALEATSYALLPYVCTSAAGTVCWPLADKAGTVAAHVIVGGATPTHAIQVEPALFAGARYIKLQVVTSGNVAVTQTASRVFWLFVRPL